LRNLCRQFFQFAVVGASGTVIQYLTMWAGVSIFIISSVAASAIGYGLGSIVNYLLNYFYTFRSRESHIGAIARYFSVLGVGFCINVGLMHFLTSYFLWNYWLAQIFTTGIGLLWNFLGSRLWAFRPAL
jgi:putative flippase GtrA